MWEKAQTILKERTIYDTAYICTQHENKQPYKLRANEATVLK